MSNRSSCVLGTLTVILCCAAWAAADDGVLPHGDAPPPVTFAHFPDTAHAFVWRNWNAVEPAILAEVLGATVDDITAMAVSMGLPAEPVLSPELKRRGYATLIRRNWHLLPYEQLLQLIEMTPERLAFILREEDFLWIKLGRRKPACQPVRYQPPDAAARARAAEIRAVVHEAFGDEIALPAEPRFDFARQIRDVPAGYTPPPQPLTLSDPRRLVYSYVAVFGDPLLTPELNPYPDGLLARLSEVGINGVWLQGLLRDLAPGGDAFPEFGENHETRLANLRELVQRAKTFGVGIYLYFNEPRALPNAFFDKHPEYAGVREGDLTALCTSHPAVRAWMSDALTHIFRAVPELAGVYAITASENLTNCASHGGRDACERCKDRSDADILAEVVQVIEEGVHRANPNAAVLISDWGWRGHGDAPDIIARLPESVYLMSVSEWHLPIERGGIQSTVGEYSISSVGPGPRSQAHWKAAREAGLKTGTEIQFNNTCEIATVPYLPVMDLIAEHCVNLREAARLDAMLIGWTMGGFPSPNFQLAHRLSQSLAPSAEAALDDVARERFGPDAAPGVRRAWTLMSEAFREYPFYIGVVYTSPVQCGPANPLFSASTGYSATMWGFPYDDLKGWRGPYPPEIFASQFEKVAQGWQPGLSELEAALQKTPEHLRTEAAGDLRLARAAAINFQSVANQARFVMARDTLAEAGDALEPEQRKLHLAELRTALESEIDLARQLFTLTREDSRIGFEPSCQYFYLPLDLVEKVLNCRWLLEFWGQNS